jgi:HlyD family secretion protein
MLLGGCKKTVKPLEGKIKRETISFTPKITGRILKIYVEEGQAVKPGDTLVGPARSKR